MLNYQRVYPHQKTQQSHDIPFFCHKQPRIYHVLIPHIFVWGSCFWFCIPGLLPASSSSSRRLPHTHNPTHIPTHTHHTHTHKHTHNTHTPHTQPPNSHTPLRGRRGTTRHPPSFCVAGAAQTHIHRRFAWQAWHSWHWVARLDWLGRPWRPWRRGTLRGRRGTNSHPPSFCVAGVAQPHSYCRFAWQAWHSWHWVARLDWLGRPWRPWRRGTLRGRRGTNSHPPSFCVAGVAQPHIHRRFAWQAWHSWHWVARLDWLGRPWRPWRRGTLRGRRGTNSHPPSFCVAGVAQPHSYCRFAWQAWHSWHWVACLDWLGRPWRPWRRGTLRGRRGTTSHPPSFCVAGVAQPHSYCRFAWQAWHSWHWVACLDWLGRPWRPWRRGTLRGRRGTTSHPPSFCVAGVSQSNIHHRFAWQAWHSWHWVACLDWLGRPWRPWRRGTLRGRRGTTSHPPSFCVAGVAQTHIHRRFTWQAWHSWHWVARLDWLGRPWRPWRRGTLRGRRGTNSHPPSFCVAGVALMALGGALGLAWSPVTPVTPRHFAWQAWHNLTSTFVLRGRRGTNSHPPSFCVAGVAQTHIHRRFAWQAWHSWHWVARLDWLGRPWRPWRRGTLAQPHIHLRFAWQAWHKLTSTVVLRGRRGTHGIGWRAWTGLVARDARDAAALCVAGVAQPHIHLRFAWQAWHNLTSTIVSRGRRGLCHTPSFTYNFHTQLCQPASFIYLFPHNFVWGSCFWFCIPGSFSSSSRLLTHTTITSLHIQQ